MKSLKTINTVDFSDEFIKQISDAKDEIKKIVDNIKKEVKTIQDKEKKDADAAKAKASGNASGNYNGGNYTDGGSNYSNNGSSSNKGGSSNSGSNRPTNPSNSGAIKYMTPYQAQKAIESAMFQVIRDYGSYMGVEANPVIGPYANDPSMANVYPQYAGDSTPQYIAQGMFNAYLRDNMDTVPHGTFKINVYVTSDYQVSAAIMGNIIN